MRSVRELNEYINDLRDELDAIVSIAEREKRDLNKDESDRATEITSELIPHAQKQLGTAIKIEAERSQRAKDRLESEIEMRSAEAAAGEVAASRATNRLEGIKVPFKAKHYGELTAFQGEDAEREAYVAGQLYLAGIFGNSAARHWCATHGLSIQGAMSTTTNSAGGFLVPDELSRNLIRLRESRGVFPQYANRVPMGADIIRVPRLLTDVTAYWVGEATEITASDATLGDAELMARKIGALTKVSSELDEDAVVQIGDMLTTSMAYAMADKIDDAGFNGDGTSTYGGVLGLKNALDSNAIQDAASGNTGAVTLDLDDFENAIGKCGMYPGASNKWYMHSAVYYASAFRLMNAAGGNDNITLADGVRRPMFMGYPVVFTQVMTSTTGASVSTILAYFGDLRLSSSYGVRRSARTEISTERYFELDQIGVKMTERVAILNHERGDTIRTRPIVALKTAAS